MKTRLALNLIALLAVSFLFIAFLAASIAQQPTVTPSPTPTEIKVTHVIFNHNMDDPKQGAIAVGESDALSMRQDFKTALIHGPVEVTTPRDETGAGEWIVDPANPEGTSKRNEPILYLRNQRQQNISIFARFEASSDVESAEIDFEPEILQDGPWAGGLLQPVQFKLKSGTPQDKFTRLGKVTVGQGVPGCFPSTTEYVKIRLVGAVPDVVSKTRAHFLWRVHKINGIPLPQPSPLNRSGIRTPQLLNDPGHNFYHVLNTPTRPWYVSLKTLPWKIALDEVVLPNAARGTSQIAEANSRMTQYVFSQKGWIYDTRRGGPGFVINGSGPVPEINLTNFIVGLGTNRRGPKVVNCYDLAGGLECYINLIGADSNYHFLAPYGYLALTDLIGIGVCNNPFFNDPLLPGPQIVADTDNRRTRRFANHAYVIDGGKVFDANVGPALGLEDETNYRLSSMAMDTPLQRARANLGGASLMLRVRIAK